MLRPSALLVCLFFALPLFAQSGAPAITEGSLQILDATGAVAGSCPLKHTAVHAEISGFVARVNVVQEFQNDAQKKIEAVYMFPLPHQAAVDGMTLQVGDHTVQGAIRKREEAQAIYTAAKQAGHVTALLNQERPNIFTQSVANIEPGAAVTVTLSYVEILEYDAGSYEFVFPMVVAPRYNPSGQAKSSDRKSVLSVVRDADKISAPVVEGARSGHDVSVEVDLDAGVPIQAVESKLHAVDTELRSAHSAHVQLRQRNEIPNRDFILRYNVAGPAIADALLTHRAAAARGAATPPSGYFTFILQPPEHVGGEDVTPKEIVFLLDTSGSMEGLPIEKAKQIITLALDDLSPSDTFNIITFAGETHVLFSQPVYGSAENIQRAKRFVAGRYGNGGTEMMAAIKAALAPSDSQDHVRIVCFLTDGEVGNDEQIISEVQNHPKARVFSFGIGTSVNRYLLSKVAEVGHGEANFVVVGNAQSEATDSETAAKKFFQRVRAPMLTDITLDWGKLPVSDVSPSHPVDLFGAKPIVITGKYTGAAKGTLTLHGMRRGIPYSREIAVNLPEAKSQNASLATLWARRRIDELSARDYMGLQTGNMKTELKQEITQLGIDYSIMTPFTSFVAVEFASQTGTNAPAKVVVPVDAPAGTTGGASLSANLTDTFYSSVPVSRGVTGIYYASPGVAAGGGTGAAGPVYNVPSLQAGTSAEVVEVTGSAITVDTTSTAVASNTSDTWWQSLPVQGGVMGVVNMSIGNSGGGGGSANASMASITGGTGLENMYVADGVGITEGGFGGIGVYSRAYGPQSHGINLSFLKETQVQTGGFEAQYGKATGGIVQVVTKSPSTRALLESKLKPDALAAFDCAKRRKSAAATCAGVRNGKLELRISVGNDPKQVLKRLKKAGLRNAKLNAYRTEITGSAALDRLVAIARLSDVLLIALQPPATTGGDRAGGGRTCPPSALIFGKTSSGTLNGSEVSNDACKSDASFSY